VGKDPGEDARIPRRPRDRHRRHLALGRGVEVSVPKGTMLMALEPKLPIVGATANSRAIFFIITWVFLFQIKKKNPTLKKRLADVLAQQSLRLKHYLDIKKNGKMILVMKKEPKIIWENEEMLVIDKPAGLVVHQDFRHTHKYTLVDWLLEKYPEIKNQSWEYEYRPGIVHRLDKDTSGLMMIAKTRKAFENLKSQIKNRKVGKWYKVLVLGRVEPKKDIIVASIGRKLSERKKMSSFSGKPAKTKYEVVNYYQLGKYQFSLLDVKIKTGRTHQIRVHMKSIGHPVVGDRLYTKGRDRKIWQEIGAHRQFLHSYRLSFIDSLTKKAKDIKINLPSDLKDILKKLEKDIDTFGLTRCQY